MGDLEELEEALEPALEEYALRRVLAELGAMLERAVEAERVQRNLYEEGMRDLPGDNGRGPTGTTRMARLFAHHHGAENELLRLQRRIAAREEELREATGE